MEKKKIDDSFYVLGTPPGEDEKIIYIHQSRKTEPELLPALFQFSLEAYLSGYSIMIPFISSTLNTVLEAAFLLDKPLYVVVRKSLDDFKLNRNGNKVMLVRGGFLSPLDLDEDDLKGNAQKASVLALERSTATLIIDNDGDVAKDSLDLGHDIAVLRQTMGDKWIRMLVKEGAPVIDSFSSWMEFPKAISFEMEKGPFREPNTGRRYSVITL